MTEITFVADVMLGKLARGLRMLGVDVLYSNVADDAEIVRLAERENRAILTRDVGLCGRRMTARCLLIDSSNAREQLEQVIAVFDLQQFDEFTRCLECNAMLENVPRETVLDRVPPFVYQTQDHFAACPSCGRVYWEGSHVDGMRKRIPARS